MNSKWLKGLSQTMYLIVSVIIILIVALVVLTLFNTNIQVIGSIGEATNNCRIAARTACASSGTLPSTWNNPSYSVEDTVYSCAGLLPNCRCIARTLQGC